MKVLVILMLWVSWAVALEEVPMLAVIDVQLQGDAKKYFSPEERTYLSTAIRSQASQILGDRVEILSKASYEKLVKANGEGCTEAGCFAGFIKEIGVDLGMQPTISYAFGELTLTLEIADNKATIASRTLVGQPSEAGKNQLGKQAIVLAKELFQEAILRLNLGKKKKSTPPAPEEKPKPQGLVFNFGDAQPENTDVQEETDTTPAVDLSTAVEPERKSKPSAYVPPPVPSKPLSSKRKWALALWGGSLGLAGVGYGADQKALTYAGDYDLAASHFASNKSDATANQLQTAYDNVNLWNNVRTTGYSLSIISLLAGVVLWVLPEEQ